MWVNVRVLGAMGTQDAQSGGCFLKHLINALPHSGDQDPMNLEYLRNFAISITKHLQIIIKAKGEMTNN